MKLTKATAYAMHAAMYMVRHATQLPVTAAEVAKGEGIPQAYLVKVFRQLERAGILRAVRGRGKRYTFAREPEDISLLAMFEAVEGAPLFQDCPLRHCQCRGTPETCYTYARWLLSTDTVRNVLGDTSLASASWNHPDHRFDESSRTDAMLAVTYAGSHPQAT